MTWRRQLTLSATTALLLLVTACGRLGFVDLAPIEIDASTPPADASEEDAGIDATRMDMSPVVDAGVDLGPETAPAVVLAPNSGLVTSESGATATYTVRLATAPTASVFLILASANLDEVTVAPTTLAFTTANWSAPQTVTLTGVDDDEQDDDQTFTITTQNATSTDTNYAGLAVDDVTGTNLDDETPGIIVTPSSGLTTSEAGASATFTIALQSAPTADVTIPISSSATDEGTVSPSSATFTMSNWSSPQVVTVTGVDDSVADGPQDYAVHVGPSASAQASYSDLSGSDVLVTNEDDETPRLVVAPLSALMTTEAGGTATFTVALGSEPTANVTVSVTSTRTSEGTVAPAVLTFTTSNWMIAQTITLTGVDDALLDGPQLYEAVVHVSGGGDAAYLGVSDVPVSVTNVDDEMPGITVLPSTGLTTSESGSSDTFTMVLDHQPAADVTVALSSSSPLEGNVSPTSVTFTSSNWSIPQTITVTGADDLVADGARAYTIITAAATSSDSNYAGFNPADVTVTNLDNDTAGVTVMPTSGLMTSEAGASATFSVVLNVEPTSDVNISLSSSDATEGTVSPASLTFTASDWSTPQIVTVTGADDFVIDGDVSYTIVTSATSSASAAYNALPVADVSVSNADNDVAGVIVTPTSGLVTTEAGTTATFTLALATQPSANVMLSFSSSDATEGYALPLNATFTNSNWNVPQTITITGVNDSVDDGDIAYTIVTSATSSSDSNYSGLAVSDVSATNSDDDTNGVILSRTSGLTTNEFNSVDSFTVVLAAAPAANVTINFSSSNTAEGTMLTSSVTFTTSSWNAPQSVLVRGANDQVYDGAVDYSVVTSATVSTDPLYDGLDVSDVSVTNQNVVVYAKASNTDPNDQFGSRVAISGDGMTAAVGAIGEASNASGVGGDQSNNASASAGSVYIFVRMGSGWVQQAYIKASNPDAGDGFGRTLSLSSNGNMLVVGAPQESSNATGIGGAQGNNLSMSSGAAYVFSRSGSTWTQEAYVKASNTGASDNFGAAVALSSDATTLAVGAYTEGSNATGIGGNQANNSAMYAGAVYLFIKSAGVWSQQAYIKASTTEAQDFFGNDVSLSSDGNTLAVGAPGEDSNATGIGGDQSNNSTNLAGAVYVFTRAGVVWTQQAYVKASDVAAVNFFGYVQLASDGNTLAVGGNSANYVYTRSGVTWTFQQRLPFGGDSSLSLDGNTLAIGNYVEDSNATGIGGDSTNTSATDAGCVRVFTRSGGVWTQEAYIKATNTNANDYFGSSHALSADGNVLIVSAPQERSSATGINGNQTDNSYANAGAAYIYE